MIDYEKLIQVHELAQKYADFSGKIPSICVEFYPNSFRNTTYIRMKYENVEHIYTLEQMIEELQNLLLPKHKYKVGQEVWFLNNSYNCQNSTVTNVYSDNCYKILDSCTTLSEDVLFPSKFELIESQIDYWLSEHCVDGNHQYVDDATGNNSKCLYCGKDEFVKKCEHVPAYEVYLSNPPKYFCKKCQGYYI